MRAFARAVHRYRWTVVAFVGFVSVAHFASAVQKEEDVLKAKTVVAENYEIPGLNGKPAAKLYRTGAGRASLIFLDEKGQLRLAVSLLPDGAPAITMFDQKQKAHVNLMISSKNNMPYLHLVGDEGNAMIELTIDKDTHPTFSIDRKGKGRILATLSDAGEPGVYLSGKPDQLGIGLEIVDGLPVIRLFGANNVVKSKWTILPDGSPIFSLMDGRSRERLSIGTDKNGDPFIRLNNPEKNTSKVIR